MRALNPRMAISIPAIMAAIMAPALAQTTDTQIAEAASTADVQRSLDTVIVTAQRRTQSANSLGMSLDVLSGDGLSDRGVTSAADLAKVVPGFVYTPTPYNTPVYTLRGVGYFDNALAASPAVSVSVDEVPLAFPAMTQAAMLDLERAEVLKGPQGTLYGQNTTGGAINYIAAHPTDEFEAEIEGTYARFDQTDINGHVSGPLADNLGARLSLRAVQGGEWQRSVSRDDRVGNSNQLMARLLVDWDVTDRLSLKFNINGWQDKSDTLAGQVIAVVPTVPARVSPDLIVQTPLKAKYADWTEDNPMRADDSFFEASVRANYDLTDSIQLVSISAYQTFDQSKFSDLDGSLISAGEFHATGDIEALNQELRVMGNTDSTNWIIGANYYQADVQDDLLDNLTDLSITQPIPFVPPFNFAAARTDQDINSWALFGKVEHNLTSRLTLNAGLRYTETTHDFVGCSVMVDPSAAELINTLQFVFNGSVVPVSVGDCGSLDEDNLPGALIDSLDEDNLSFRVGVDYDLSGGGLLYANISRGYKSGGYPVLLTLSNSSFASIPQEELVAYEAGAKIPLFDRSVQLNGAVFYYDYSNKQLHGRTVDPFFGLIEKLVSVPESEVTGAEISLTARPAEGLDLSIAASYVDTEVVDYTGYNAAGILADFSGSAFPNTSEYQIVGDIQYSWDVLGNASAFIGAGLTYASCQSATFGDDPVFRIDPRTLIDLRAGVDFERFGVSIWGRNVTDEYYWNGVFQASDSIYRQPARPATYGITLSYKFD